MYLQINYFVHTFVAMSRREKCFPIRVDGDEKKILEDAAFMIGSGGTSTWARTVLLREARLILAKKLKV